MVLNSPQDFGMQRSNDFMIGRGFSRFEADKCVYKHGVGITLLFVAIDVDHLIISGATLEIMEEFKPQLSQKFKMKDLGPIKHCLGMEIIQDLGKGTIEINQSGYVETILRRFGMLKAKTANTNGIRSPSSQGKI